MHDFHTNSMEQRPHSESNTRLASPVTPRLLIDPEGSEPVTSSITKPDESGPRLHALFI